MAKQGKAKIIREITVVTGTRAEYGMLKPLLEKIRSSSDLALKLVVTGMHLLEKCGLTINEIKEDGFEITDKIQMYLGDESDPAYHGKALAKGIEGFTQLLMRIGPRILVVTGDRLEALAAAVAAATLNIPIAHIHGGDKTDSGHIDEPIRHSITRFAHIHFPPTREHADRLIKMGEEPWRVFQVGALGLDSILNQKPIAKQTLSKQLGINPNEKIITCIFHPVLLEKESMGSQMHEILESVSALKTQTVVIYPNNDAGSHSIISEIERYKDLPFIRALRNLPHIQYISLLKHADVLIGNSSSGIIEAPSLKLPVINIGSRNTGRQHAENVIFVNTVKKEIINAIQIALYDEDFNEKVRQCKNPWGDGKTSGRIVRILSEAVIDKKLLQKRITY
jgi:GDP/UDP-N,N'-diacetylbacillosamine 2-epimerase (hydrolysing)